MKVASRHSLLIILALVVAAFPLRAEAIGLNELLTGLGAQLEWEPLRQIARVSLGDSEVVFKVGAGSFILNQSRRMIMGAAFRQNGAIMLPEDTATALSAHLTGELAVAGSPRVAVVMIDPGHGGKDPGAIGRHKVGDSLVEIREKDIVLDVSVRLRDLLSKRFPTKEIVLTRDVDEYLSLEQRTEIANAAPLEEHEAIIFISLHVNAALKRDAAGFEVWFLPPDFKRDLSDRTGVQEGSEEIIPILSTMLEEQYTTESVLLARDILQGLDRAIGSVSENRGLKEEIWFVVRNSKMPAVLIELGFITNPEEGGRFADPEHLRLLTAGIYNGVLRFIRRFEASRGFTRSS